jgi:hypothetical protein
MTTNLYGDCGEIRKELYALFFKALIKPVIEEAEQGHGSLQVG